MGTGSKFVVDGVLKGHDFVLSVQFHTHLLDIFAKIPEDSHNNGKH